jgi:hypothetical protein
MEKGLDRIIKIDLRIKGYVKIIIPTVVEIDVPKVGETQR